ncbi:MAG: DUF2911 domain-containing protein [Lewinellaceae bacterium]|nr:DUF2911 domain-containing protein [Lewinellaceae bacterium]
MKNLILTLTAVLFVGGMAFGQIKTPAPSPLCITKQIVGLTDVEIEYSRPSMKGRKIYGDLVPFGETWRTGANASTKISFSTDVTIDGKAVKAGKYALFTIPGVDNWVVILYKDLTTWGVPTPYKVEDEVIRFNVKPKKMDITVETLLINIGSLRNNTAQIEIIWENTLVEFDVDFGTDALVQEGIDRVLNGPSADDYYRAARYYKDENKDLVQALTWVRKSNEMDARYWRLFLQAQLEDELMQYDAAIASAEKAKAAAQKEEAADYVRRSDKLIADVKAKMGSKGNEPGKVKPSGSTPKM